MELFSIRIQRTFQLVSTVYARFISENIPAMIKITGIFFNSFLLLFCIIILHISATYIIFDHLRNKKFIK